MAVRLSPLIIALLLVGSDESYAVQPASLEPVRREQCVNNAPSCADFDAIVFVHGVFGEKETFRNKMTGFDWTMGLPMEIKGRKVDIFRLTYRTALLSWARDSNPGFETVAGSVMEALGPLRRPRTYTR